MTASQVKSIYNYPVLLDAVRGLLLDTCRILNESKVEFVIAGGWAAYLRGQDSVVRHPGTRDVDVLFNDAVLAEIGHSHMQNRPRPINQ